MELEVGYKSISIYMVYCPSGIRTVSSELNLTVMRILLKIFEKFINTNVNTALYYKDKKPNKYVIYKTKT